MTKITLKQIDGNIATVAKLGTEFNLFIQETALMIVRHAAPSEINDDCVGSGDCTRAIKLARAMPASMRREMLALWFKTFTPIRIKISDNGDRCEFDPIYKKQEKAAKINQDPTKGKVWWNLTEAAETSFGDVAEANREQEVSLLDFADLIKMVTSVSKRIEKQIAENKVKPEDLPYAHAIAAKVANFKVQRPKTDEEDKREQEEAKKSPVVKAAVNGSPERQAA